MSAFIEELKQEHSTLVKILKEIKTFGIQSDNGKQKLSEIKTILLDHLKKEDSILYPFLKSHSHLDDDLLYYLNFFESEMKGITQKVIQFYTKYDSSNNPLECVNDFEKIFIALDQRIRKEESILYEKYDNFIKSGK